MLKSYWVEMSRRLCGEWAGGYVVGWWPMWLLCQPSPKNWVFGFFRLGLTLESEFGACWDRGLGTWTWAWQYMFRLSTKNYKPRAPGSLRHLMLKVFCAIFLTAPYRLPDYVPPCLLACLACSLNFGLISKLIILYSRLGWIDSGHIPVLKISFFLSHFIVENSEFVTVIISSISIQTIH